ncbi:MAG: hypothetical protein ACRD88_20575 [Terriglobia bacterium]
MEMELSPEFAITAKRMKTVDPDALGNPPVTVIPIGLRLVVVKVMESGGGD